MAPSLSHYKIILLQVFQVPVPSLSPSLQPPWPPCCSTNTPGIFPSHGFCPGCSLYLFQVEGLSLIFRWPSFSLSITSSRRRRYLYTRDPPPSSHHSPTPQPEITWVIFACSRRTKILCRNSSAWHVVGAQRPIE